MTRRSLATLAGALALLLVFAPAAAARSERAIDYVALGDSVASGYGLGASPAPCYRARGAYPERVRDTLRSRHAGTRFRFLACAGATASGGEGMRSLHRQVTAALHLLSARPALVSLTAGINDLEWWNLARLAILVRQSDARFTAWLDGAVGGVRDALERELARLLERPGVSVVATGYYDPLNPGSAFFRNRLVCPDERVCRERVDRVLARLDAAIRSAVRRADAPRRVRFAPVAGSFEGHESARPACGDSRPDAAVTWIQDDCFHPNGLGARSIAAAVDRAARRLGM